MLWTRTSELFQAAVWADHSATWWHLATLTAAEHIAEHFYCLFVCLGVLYLFVHIKLPKI